MNKNYAVELSLVIPTLARTQQVEALLESILNARIEVQFEVILVDQNFDGRLDGIVQKYQEKLPLQRLRTEAKGASRARNVGARHARGKIIAFPDDDAELAPDTVSQALDTLSRTQAQCIFGRCVDKKTRQNTVCPFQPQASWLTLQDFEGKFVEATMFIHKTVLEKYPYDENLGIGTLFGSEEAYDLVYRMLQDGVRIFYSPEVVYFHPDKVNTRRTEAEVRRAFNFGCGMGALCRKHRLKKKFWKQTLKTCCAVGFVFLFRHAQWRYYTAQLFGLLLGYKVL